MPALNHGSSLQPRNEGSGRNFSIIFAVIAFLIVAGCLFWGIFLPKYRKKHPARPVSTRYNSHLQTQFPSHPAILRGFRKQSSGELRTYNPRTQTPFPNTPPDDSTGLRASAPANRPAVDIGSSNALSGIYSPARDRLPSRRGLVGEASFERKSFSEQQWLSERYINDILPVPEPMALCPRPAGRPPTLARQLAKFPMPRSGSAETGDLAHPRKLFEDLEHRHSNATTSTSAGTPSPPQIPSQSATEHEQPELQHTRKVWMKPRDHVLNHESGNTQIVRNIEMGKKVDITRAGTITRPKTPVAEIRDLYDSKARGTVTREGNSSKSATLSSVEIPAESMFSDYLRTWTPPTSLILRSESLTEPTFLNQEKDPIQHRTIVTPTPHRSCGTTTAGSMAPPNTDRLAPMDTIVEGKKGDFPCDEKVKNPGMFRPRPARLNLIFSTRSSSILKRAQRHSMSSVSSLLLPLQKSKRPSFQGSSIYSRDTRGVSIIRSPLSPEFSDSAAAGGEKDESLVRPLARKASSLELLHRKIDNWDLHTTYLDFSTSPSSTLKRALSDLGPRSPALHVPRPASTGAVGEGSPGEEGGQIPKICIGRPSDDIFRDSSPVFKSGRVMKRVLDMEGTSCMAGLVRTPSKGSAPGGADWI